MSDDQNDLQDFADPPLPEVPGMSVTEAILYREQHLIRQDQRRMLAAIHAMSNSLAAHVKAQDRLIADTTDQESRLRTLETSRNKLLGIVLAVSMMAGILSAVLSAFIKSKLPWLS